MQQDGGPVQSPSSCSGLGAAPVGKIGGFSIEAGASHNRASLPPAKMVPGREKFKLFSALKTSHFGRFPAGLGSVCAPLAGKNHGRAGIPALTDVNAADPISRSRLECV
jgi:hypothetical protein